jgi:hypothetical protein
MIKDELKYETDWCIFQIGQCRLHVNIKKTKDYYANLPKISENCACSDCKYFELEAINQTNQLFELLVKMGVDLSRQPDINPDGISCIGESSKGFIGYMGYYFVYGGIGKTSKKTQVTNTENRTVEVSFNNAEFGKQTMFTIKQAKEDKLLFDFYIEVEKSLTGL